MRSAAVFSSNLRLPGPRPGGRAGKLRRPDVDNQRRIARAQVASRKTALAPSRIGSKHRRAAPRTRPVRKVAVEGFAAMVLH
jgi:hypothetical protein